MKVPPAPTLFPPELDTTQPHSQPDVPQIHSQPDGDTQGFCFISYSKHCMHNNIIDSHVCASVDIIPPLDS